MVSKLREFRVGLESDLIFNLGFINLLGAVRIFIRRLFFFELQTQIY
jgi:hypothetical protein